ncbi:MAG: hypothetical protein RIS94_3690 [Pseudomonadota bacterium]
MRMEGVFVPAYHTTPVQDLLDGTSPGSKLHGNRMYSLPLLPFAAFVVALLGVHARAA